MILKKNKPKKINNDIFLWKKIINKFKGNKYSVITWFK